MIRAVTSAMVSYLVMVIRCLAGRICLPAPTLKVTDFTTAA